MENRSRSVLNYQIEIEGARIDDKIKTPTGYCLEAGGDGNVC